MVTVDGFSCLILGWSVNNLFYYVIYNGFKATINSTVHSLFTLVRTVPSLDSARGVLKMFIKEKS